MTADQQNEVLIFQKNNRFFGCPAQAVREVIPGRDLAQVPLAPKWVLGVLRDQDTIYPAVDMGAFLGLVDAPDSATNRFILIDSDQLCCAIAADLVFNVVVLGRADSIEPLTPATDQWRDAVPRFKYDDKELLLPDLQSLIGDEREDATKPMAGAAASSITDDFRYLLEFFAAGVPLAAAVSSVHSIANVDGDSAREPPTDQPGVPTTPLSESLGLQPSETFRTLVVQREQRFFGFNVDAISRSPISRHKISPVPALLHHWITPMVYAGIALGTTEGSLLLVVDLERISGKLSAV